MIWIIQSQSHSLCLWKMNKMFEGAPNTRIANFDTPKVFSNWYCVCTKMMY